EAAVRAAFLFVFGTRVILKPYVALPKIICCYANKSVVAGIWYTVIVPRQRCGDPLRFRKGDDNVQDCLHRLHALHHPVRPPHGLDRPPSDDLGPRCRAQWRSPLFRPLRPVNAGVLTSSVLRSPPFTQINRLDKMAPASGAILHAREPRS